MKVIPHLRARNEIVPSEPLQMKHYYLQQMGISRWILRQPQRDLGVKLMIIGEVPNAHDDQQGLSFVGKASSLLQEMIRCMGLDTKQVYMARSNIPDLAQTIKLIQPTVILAMGTVVGQYVLNTSLSLEQMRSRTHQYEGVHLIVSYHPSDLLAHPADKKKAYQDCLACQAILAQG